MARAYPHSHVAHGRLVGYSLKKRGNDPCYYVYFRGRDNRRLERDTGQTSIQRAHSAAHAIIEEEYTPITHAQDTVSWDEATRRMEEKAQADGRRAPTIDYYRKLIRR